MSFCLSYRQDILYTIPWCAIRSKLSLPYFIKLLRNRESYIKTKFVGQSYEAFRNSSTDIRPFFSEKNSFCAVSSQLLSLSLKIVRNSFLAWSLILDRILSKIKARGAVIEFTSCTREDDLIRVETSIFIFIFI